MRMGAQSRLVCELLCTNLPVNNCTSVLVGRPKKKENGGNNSGNKLISRILAQSCVTYSGKGLRLVSLIVYNIIAKKTSCFSHGASLHRSLHVHSVYRMIFTLLYLYAVHYQYIHIHIFPYTCSQLSSVHERRNDIPQGG